MVHKYNVNCTDCVTYGFQNRNGFQSGGAMEHWKVLSAIMVERQEKFLDSRRSRMAKTVTFWPWWQLFNSFCFQTLSFFSLFPFHLFATQKWGRLPPPPRPSWCRWPCFSVIHEQVYHRSCRECSPNFSKQLFSRCHTNGFFW